MRCGTVLGLAFVFAAAPAGGQASLYLPTDDWLTPIVEHLIRAGVIDDPDPLTRPLSHRAIASALAAADTARLDPALRRTLRLVRSRLDLPDPEPTYLLDLYLEPAGATHDGRDPLRTVGGDWTGVRGGMRMRATMGPLVLSAEPYFDTHVDDDPDWPGDETVVDIPGRFTNAYFGLRSTYADATFGAVARNWGAPGLAGLLLSDFPYTYDHLAVRLGSDHLRVETVLTQLEGFPSGAAVINRFFVAHRVSFRPTRRLMFAIGSGAIWRGVGATFEPRWLNPFKLPRVTAVDEGVPDSSNSAYAGDLRLVLPGRAVLSAQLLLDDWDVTPSDRGLPDRVGGSVVIDVPVRPQLGLRAYYTGVSSLAYRTSQGPDFAFLRSGIGLGRNHSDYMEASLAASFLAGSAVLVEPEVVWLRQGESDLGEPFPLGAGADYPFVLVGVVETTWRVATAVRVTLPGTLDLSGHAGVHLVRNAAHVPNDKATDVVGGLAVRWRFFSGRWR